MYLRTPKRYQAGRKQSRNIISLRWLWLWILTPIVVAGGLFIYQQREVFGPPLREAINNAVNDAQQSISTVVAPTPLPTADPSLQLEQANNLWAAGNIEGALDIYMPALQNAPNDVTAHYRVAFGYIMQGQPEEALQYAERTITANPYSSDAWAIRSLALSDNQQYAAAAASAQQSLALNPNNTRASAFLAEAYYGGNRMELALSTVNRALEVNPDLAEGYYVRGLLNRFHLINYTAARDDLERAYELAPNYPYIAIALAEMEQVLQNYDVSQEILLDVLEQNPENRDALYAIGFLYYSAYGSPEQAATYLERCVSLDPDNRACLRYLGTLYNGTGNSSEAVRMYQALLDTETTRPRDYLGAGIAYINAGNCNTAINVLEQGYQYELQSELPETSTLTLFEDYLTSCGANVNSLFPSAATAEATEEFTEDSQ